MYYVETSVLASYILASDFGHEASRRALEEACNYKLYVSSYTLIELHNTICRRIIKGDKWKLIDPLQEYIEVYEEVEEKCKFLLSMIIGFLKERLNVEFLDETGIYDLMPMGLADLKIPKIFKKLADLSPRLLTRTKDLLHLTYASIFSNAYGIRYFLTRDIEDFGRIKDEVKNLLKIEVVLVQDIAIA
ncbi:MAG: PIN domain-containing protein [Pyrobaculum sp.]|uniref:PIN domain-containing protein n=1 Tax=Pyrobaculum sp. TaxID=2004705 RepID=UPI00315E2F37